MAHCGFKKSVSSLLGINYLCDTSACACLMWNRLHWSVCLCFCEMDYPTKWNGLPNQMNICYHLKINLFVCMFMDICCDFGSRDIPC